MSDSTRKKKKNHVTDTKQKKLDALYRSAAKQVHKFYKRWSKAAINHSS